MFILLVQSHIHTQIHTHTHTHARTHARRHLSFADFGTSLCLKVFLKLPSLQSTKLAHADARKTQTHSNTNAHHTKPNQTRKSSNTDLFSLHPHPLIKAHHLTNTIMHVFSYSLIKTRFLVSVSTLDGTPDQTPARSMTLH